MLLLLLLLRVLAFLDVVVKLMSVHAQLTRPRNRDCTAGLGATFHSCVHVEPGRGRLHTPQCEYKRHLVDVIDCF